MSEEEVAESALLNLIRVTRNLRQECSKLRSLNEDLRTRLSESEEQRAVLQREKQRMSEELSVLKDRLDKLSEKDEDHDEDGCLEKEEHEDEEEQKREEQATVDVGGPAAKPEAKKAQRRPMDERRQFLIQVIQLIRCHFRGYFGESFADKWGFFVDRNMSTEIHSFADWIEYPKGNYVLNGHSDGVWCAAISRDGCYVYSGAGDHQIIKWDLRSNMIITRFKAHDSAVLSLAHTPGLLISGSEFAKIKVWNKDDHSLIHTLEGHTVGVTNLSLNKRGNILVSGSSDRTCQLWSLKSGECLRIMEGHTGFVTGLLFAGNVILSGSEDESIRIWDPQSGKELKKITDGINSEINNISLNCDSSALACCHSNGFTVFKYPSMKAMNTIEMDTIYSQFHPSIPTILAVSDYASNIQVYRIDTSELIRVIKGHSSYVFCLAFSPDGHRLISTSTDHSIRVWDVSDIK